MGKTIEEKKAMKSLMEQIPLYFIMTNPNMIQMYIDHIRETPLGYEADDEESEKDQIIEDLREIVEGRGKEILQELFANDYINNFDSSKLAEFAKRFAGSDEIMNWLYWLQLLVGYHFHLVMMYAFFDYEPNNAPVPDKKTHSNRKSKNKQSKVIPSIKNVTIPTSVSTANTQLQTDSEPVFRIWKEGLEWLADCYEKKREHRKSNIQRPKVVSVPFGGMNKRHK